MNDTAEQVLLEIGAKQWGMEDLARQALDEAPSYASPGDDLVIVAWEVFLELLEIYEATEQAFANAMAKSPVLNYLRKRLPREEDAEDLAQEIFYSIWGSLTTFRPYRVDSWDGWQYMIAKRKLNSHLKYNVYGKEIPGQLNEWDAWVEIDRDSESTLAIRRVCNRWIEGGGDRAKFASEILAISRNEAQYIGLTGPKMSRLIGVSTSVLFKWTGEITEEILSENI